MDELRQLALASMDKDPKKAIDLFLDSIHANEKDKEYSIQTAAHLMLKHSGPHDEIILKLKELENLSSSIWTAYCLKLEMSKLYKKKQESFQQMEQLKSMLQILDEEVKKEGQEVTIVKPGKPVNLVTERANVLGDLGFLSMHRREYISAIDYCRRALCLHGEDVNQMCQLSYSLFLKSRADALTSRADALTSQTDALFLLKAVEQKLQDPSHHALYQRALYIKNRIDDAEAAVLRGLYL